MRARARHLTIAAATGAMFVAAGCADAAERVTERGLEAAIESQGGGEVDLDLDDNGSVSVETEDGSFSMGQTEIPDDWPSEVPLPPDLEVQSVTQQREAESGITSTMVMGSTDMAPEQVAELYADALSSWDETMNTVSSSAGASSVQVAFERPERDSVLVMANQDSTGTFVTIAYGQQGT